MALILNKNVKSLSIPCLFSHEGKNQDGKPYRIWQTCELQMRIWNEDDFADDYLYLMLGKTGHFIGGKSERRLKLFYKHLETCEPIDFHSKRTGLTITRTASKPVKEGTILELYNSHEYAICELDEHDQLVLPQLTFE
jgi:hypothetical protein